MSDPTVKSGMFCHEPQRELAGGARAAPLPLPLSQQRHKALGALLLPRGPPSMPVSDHRLLRSRPLGRHPLSQHRSRQGRRKS